MKHTLLSGVVGSTAYGLAGPDSDIDRLAIGTYDTKDFFRLEDPPASAVTTNPDFTIHEARKALKLLLSCNPTISELLWLGEYEYSNILGRELIHIRRTFLSAPLIRSAYLGYALQQFARLKNRGDGSFSADTRKRTAKHARHLARLCEQGFQLYAHGQLQVRLEDPQYYLDFGERVAAGDIKVAEEMLATTEDNFNNNTSSFPQQPDTKAAEDWLLRVRRHYA